LSSNILFLAHKCIFFVILVFYRTTVLKNKKIKKEMKILVFIPILLLRISGLLPAVTCLPFLTTGVFKRSELLSGSSSMPFFSYYKFECSF